MDPEDLIGRAYARYDSDRRVNGMHDYDAFSEAIHREIFEPMGYFTVVPAPRKSRLRRVLRRIFG